MLSSPVHASPADCHHRSPPGVDLCRACRGERDSATADTGLERESGLLERTTSARGRGSHSEWPVSARPRGHSSCPFGEDGARRVERCSHNRDGQRRSESLVRSRVVPSGRRRRCVHSGPHPQADSFGRDRHGSIAHSGRRCHGGRAARRTTDRSSFDRSPGGGPTGPPARAISAFHNRLCLRGRCDRRRDPSASDLGRDRGYRVTTGTLALRDVRRLLEPPIRDSPDQPGRSAVSGVLGGGSSGVRLAVRSSFCWASCGDRDRVDQRRGLPGQRARLRS
jgi:hypothetical protein